MIQNIPLEKVLFIDIETVPQSGDWNSLSETDQNLWDKKTKIQRKEDFTAEEFYAEADFTVHGRIFGVQILALALRIILDKNCRRLYNRFKHMK